MKHKNATANNQGIFKNIQGSADDLNDLLASIKRRENSTHIETTMRKVLHKGKDAYTDYCIRVKLNNPFRRFPDPFYRDSSGIV